MAIGLQEEARDELLCEIDHWKDRAEGATQKLIEIVGAIDSGNLEMNSTEIDVGDPDIPPHPWHEEWLHLVRAFLEAKS